MLSRHAPLALAALLVVTACSEPDPRARANDAWGRMRPARREEKPEAYARTEDACIGKE